MEDVMDFIKLSNADSELRELIWRAGLQQSTGVLIPMDLAHQLSEIAELVLDGYQSADKWDLRKKIAELKKELAELRHDFHPVNVQMRLSDAHGEASRCLNRFSSRHPTSRTPGISS